VVCASVPLHIAWLELGMHMHCSTGLLVNLESMSLMHSVFDTIKAFLHLRFSEPIMRFKSLRSGVVGVLGAAVSCFYGSEGLAASASYSLQQIAGTSDGYSWFGTPEINNNASLVFTAGFNGGANTGIFLSSGGTLQKIVDNTGDVFGVGVGRLNNSDVVAFDVSMRIGAGPDQIRTYNHGVYETVVTRYLLGDINDSGTVSYASNISGGHYGFLTRGAAGTTVIVGASASDPVPTYIGQMSADGSVPFGAYGPGGVVTLYLGNGGPLSTIATTAPGGGFSSIDDFEPVINKAGVVAFWGTSTTQGAGYFLANGSTIEKLSFNSGISPISRSLSLNSDLEYSFLGSRYDAETHSFYSGVFVHANGSDEEVIKVGDALFGSVVTNISVSSQALNDGGQVAFVATLGNGAKAVVLATPVSEPEGLALYLGGLLLLMPFTKIAGIGNRKSLG